jgi:hypothetical protein
VQPTPGAGRPPLAKRSQTTTGRVGEGQPYVPSGSPTHVQSSVRPGMTHQRKDSDTLRSFPRATSSTSLDALNAHSRASPTARDPARSVTGSTSNLRAHRRVPTAPDASASSYSMPPGLDEHGAGRGRDGGMMYEHDMVASNGRPRIRTQQMQPSYPPASAPPVDHHQYGHPMGPPQTIVPTTRSITVCISLTNAFA